MKRIIKHQEIVTEETTSEKCPLVRYQRTAYIDKLKDTTTHGVGEVSWVNDAAPDEYCKQLMTFRNHIKIDLPCSIQVPKAGLDNLPCARWYEWLTDKGQKSLGYWTTPKEVWAELDWNTWNQELAEELKAKYFNEKGFIAPIIEAEDIELGDEIE